MAISDTIDIDQQLIHRITLGDEVAFRKLFDRYYPIMVNKANMILKDEHLAKDAVQNVFVGIWNNRSNFQISTSLPGYLSRAAINKSLNLLESRKKHGGRSDYLEDNVSEEKVSAHGEMEAADMKKRIHLAINELPEKCRLIFVMNRIEGLSHKEIAEQMDISTKTIENQMTKALKFLRTQIYWIGMLILNLF